MEIPRRFIDDMIDTSSKDSRWLAYDEASSMEDVPSVAEWLGPTCGAMSKSEKDVMSKIGAEISWPKNVSQRDRMLYDQLNKRATEIFRCEFKKISRARECN